MSETSRPAQKGRRVSAKRSAVVLIAGSVLGFLLGMAKSIVLARFLTVADYGIVGTFTAVLNLVQMSSSFNFQLLLVQHRSGDDIDFGSAVKGLTMARQILMAIVIVALGQPLADLMGQPDLAWAYRCLALAPLISAFNNPDLVRMKRQRRFGPQLANTIVPGVITLLAIWPLVRLIGDYRVQIVIALMGAALSLVGSHLLAERPFRVRWDWDVARLGLRFGWPLMVSGIVLFGAFQGDRIIVANFYSDEDLGLIAAALAMITAPALFASALVREYFLPILAPYQDHLARFAERAVFTLQATLCAGLVACLGFALAGPFMLTLAFGPKYAAGGDLVALLGIAFSIQLMRSGASTVALAKGDTLNMLIGNMVRLAFLAPAVLIAIRGMDLITVLAIGAAGQVAAYATGVALLYLRSNLHNGCAMILPYGFAAASLGCLGVAIWQPEAGYAVPGPAVAASVLFLLATIAASGNMLQEVWRQTGLSRP